MSVPSTATNFHTPRHPSSACRAGTASALALKSALPYAGRMKNRRMYPRHAARWLAGLLLTATLTHGPLRADTGEGGPPIVDKMREQILNSLALKPGMTIGEIGIG